MHSQQQFCYPLSRAILRAVPLMIVFVLAAVPASAQNAVPPTARQAAASPAFASRLAHQVPAHPATKSRALTRSRRASPQDQIVYDNGPYNGTNDAWAINFGFAVSDSYALSGGTVTRINVVYWDASSTDLLTTVDYQFGSSSFSGNIRTSGAATNQFISTNQYGYFLYSASFDVSNSDFTGANGFVTLSNACTTSGCSVSNPIYWDENSGPSTAYENTLGSIPSEAFSLDGVGPPQCQNRSYGNFQMIHEFTGGGDGAIPTDLIIDQAGNLYGTTLVGGSGSAGTVFKMAQNASGWVFDTLYSFAGGYNGGPPFTVILGPDHRLYGSALGGIQNCPGGYCNVIFDLKPSPTACLTALCGWTEDVLYRFAGGSDPYGWIFGNDRAGNLYGLQGGNSIFLLAKLGGKWTKTTLYTFSGGNGGTDPYNLLLGHDGKIYGLATGGANGYGLVFQVQPSGSGWTENVLFNFDENTAYVAPNSLIQDSSGNLYGLGYSYDLIQYGFEINAVVYMLSSPTWAFNELATIHPGTWDSEVFANLLAIDNAGNLYGNDSAYCITGCDLGDPWIASYIFRVAPNQGGWYDNVVLLQEGFDVGGGGATDNQGNVYGVGGCTGPGVVWQVLP